jgi:uncharacterized protein YdaU (DUF1376 family)
MGATKAPAFQFYPADFLSDARVAIMSMEQRGIYITLLCHCWKEGSIPDDIAKLARLCHVADKGGDTTLWSEVLDCFVVDDDDSTQLVQPRLQIEREKQEAWRLKSAQGGKNSRKSSRIHDKRGVRVVQPPLKEFPPECFDQGPTLQSSSSSSISPLSPPKGGGRKRRSDVRREEILTEALS